METESKNSWTEPPDEFSFVPERWNVWKFQFLRYLNSSGKTFNTDKDKIDLLIYLMGEQGELMYREFSVRPNTIDSALKAFDQYFNPKQHLGCLRASFHKRVQTDEETVEDFVEGLRNIANNCEFGSMKDELIRDKIIAGLKDTQLSYQLQLENNLTLEDTIQIAKEAEKKKLQESFSGSEINDIKPIPSTSSFQGLYQKVSQAYDTISSSTDESTLVCNIELMGSH